MTNKFVILILLLAFILSAWNIYSIDLISDDAVYSFRALGWFDYLAADEQTGPVQWFGHIPWWANLSFHDAPPLVFAVQKVFFSIFGDNPIGARLPFIISFLATLYVVFLISKELHSKVAAYASITLMSLLSFSYLAANAGFLEGIEILFISGAIYFWIRFLKSDDNKFLYWCSLVTGLAILCKYTAVFLPVVFMLHLIAFRRNAFKKKHIYLAILLLLVVLLPVIAYNLALFNARGHFDAPFASLFRQKTDDYFSLRNRSAENNIFESVWVIFKNLGSSISFAVLFFLVISFIYQLFYYFRDKNSRQLRFVILASLFFAFMVFGLGGTQVRFLIILIPILAVIFGLLSGSLIRKSRPEIKKMLLVLIIVVFGFEFFYNINSNFLTHPLSKNKLIYTSEGLGSRKMGFNKLEKYLKSELLPDKLDIKRPNKLDDIDIRVIANIKNNGVIYFFDDSTNWFAHNWYFRKYSNYYGIPMTPFYEQARNFNSENVINDFVKLGVHNFYYIYGVNQSVIDPKKINGVIRSTNSKLAKMLKANGTEYHEIKNHLGEVAFRIYKFSVKSKID